jgi:hypothetical protein
MDKLVEALSHDDFMASMSLHKMTVLRDDELYKHIRFAAPNEFENAFEVMSFPYHVLITGDMGCYTFSREKDMFEWFVKGHCAPIKRPEIEVSRWFAKMVSKDAAISAKHYYLPAVIESIEEAKSNYTEGRGDCSLEVEQFNELLEWKEYGAEKLLDEMQEFYLDSISVSPFQDLERDCYEVYSTHFVWCCYALNYGIGTYRKQTLFI